MNNLTGTERNKHELLQDMKELAAHEEGKWYKIPFKYIFELRETSVLFGFDRYAFRNPNTKQAREPVWFPREMLRKYDGEIYFPAMLSAQKGLNI